MKEISYKPTIGLEIHVELKTKSKMFCPCKNDSTEKRANFNICPICMGHPGTLPVPNEEAIKKVIKAGIALNCKISKESKFDRKNYFYPDLPKGYQISQYDMPLCQNGFLNIGERKIKIRRIHIEEDTGRLLHSEKGDYSLIDFNRAGIPLMELVTEPDIKSGKEARKFAEELQLILKYLDVSNADMEKGEMRVEVNISLSKDLKNLGTKVEIKNLNSF
ncbi:MAG TPA: Asp-tRNA(Asn)/Glu-tRNA(Gln) amidotransferase subunit GatB, partial [Candidatus Pacearchaeota archaeon]|nr:Asp-tRNA(Asn)/Glu-tRNA(Gln) amidotransferase subunit GatB [Candidatus Pacearchaeota archaeon]